ncbi:hypothetical protein Coch_1098 [Capnocytophaga ochracea DSM 7271]|uniref:Bacteriocin-type signal sequence n=1 Tax=Capnocytophaga ochracea (strain ATCC 27872 / DSM 7271 / CCUG 9716 / JCM 12966 / NCTC 12371 / SS31 / VPI 2845) TaxID=521097 RepID=C7M498_CAPOD|nr:bacteriocin [Capnocytophaga ochracea]ACU92653.1 hypothetical protein Coch_1098 [Capnocytophaga ochracea DSM 7271]UAK51376.1 bacteriocin [Capnocytophaga ochracea]
MTLKRTQQVEAQGVKKLDSFKGFETLNSKELQGIEGGCGHLNIMNIIERDGCRPKGHRWKWFWQDEY